MAMIVAIDGPAGAGKSTVARLLAERLGFRYLDTGAMYRALTWLAMREGLPLADGDPLGDLARKSPVVFDEVGRVFIGGCDVTSAIRQSRIDRMVPVVARHHEVREVMRVRQRELASQGNAVIEGRDIGTVVAPNAEVKVYLQADEEIRAQRRQTERPDIGADALATDLRTRDESDRVRMQPAEDAVLIDTTSLQVDDVVSRIEELVRARSDREAVRRMRESARTGRVVGLFVEGTRQRSGIPGRAQPGAAMVALQEDVPVIPIAVYGTQFWKIGNFAPCSIAFGEPVRFEGLPRGGKGYKEATAEIERRIHLLVEWLAGVHAQGRPRGLT